MASFFEMMRQATNEIDHASHSIKVQEEFAKHFEPKEDITPYELAMIFKLVAMAGVSADDSKERQKIRELGLGRHFNVD